TRRQIDHPHVAPEYARPQPGTERLGTGLLGGKALRVGLDPVGAALGPRPLGVGKDARQEALAMALDHALDPARVAKIGANADDHASAADLKLLHHFQQILLGSSNRKAALDHRVASACPGKAGTGFPTRTCATQTNLVPRFRSS